MRRQVNEAGFIRAYDELADKLFRHCYFRVWDREVAKDLVQETFTRTWKYLTDGGKIKSMKAFLYKVANNLVVDHTRKKKAFSLEMLRDKGFEPAAQEEKVEDALDVQAIMGILKRLERRDSEIIVMRYIDDLRPGEIAKILGESENVISVRLNRAVKKVRGFLQ